MKSLSLLFIVTAVLLPCKVSFILTATIPCSAEYFETDPLKNIYIVNGKEISRYDKQSNRTAVYSNNFLGRITHVDVIDPFRILLFYKDYNQVLFLDKNLAEIGSPIVLDDISASQVNVVCASTMGGFWLYNEQSLQLEYYDKNLQLMQQSVRLSNVTVDMTVPDFMLEKNDFVYLHIPQKGIFVFDRYGGFVKKIPIQTGKTFRIADNFLVYYSENKIFRYDLNIFNESSIFLPDTANVLDAKMDNENLYILKKDKIDIYRIKR